MSEKNMSSTTAPSGWWSPDDPTHMLALARINLVAWREAKDKSTAERRAARMIAFAFGRLDELATGGQLPAGWRYESVVFGFPDFDRR